ncbi:MAG: hypothetical protein COW47_02415 [Candidatus Huberarchaeum crystalense]|uniref:Uncharacterized protein n=1 Tax=Huberarchaeum crystalense TaxID=2014257 RepID=A0A2G9LIR8_HUBC1|nr:hypothetical protein [archaeon]OIP20325.1 MAG: hypothetical protein AUJ91_01545 [archaeon CG2_30_31_98]PIN66437.1 MAG: hypothetical protein COW69_02295 [Candidatus Huberarchaeum crystalense]NCS98552.1 hypothetical protein [archaeon]PIV13637.1 MAG: hypothetical protein COS45_01775 [Candidatus Huberarchaeum crystalense]
MAKQEIEVFKQIITYEGDDPMKVYKTGKVKSLFSTFGDISETYTFKQRSPTDFWFKIELKSKKKLSEEDICIKEIANEIGVKIEGNLKRQPVPQGQPTETGNVEVEIKGKFIFDRKEYIDDDISAVGRAMGRGVYEMKQGVYNVCVLNPLKEKYKKILIEQGRKVYEEVKATFNLQKLE